MWGTPDSDNSYTQRARDMAAQTGEAAQGHASYAGQKLSESAQAAADAAQRVTLSLHVLDLVLVLSSSISH